MNAAIAKAIIDLQTRKGRFEECISVPEMCDEFVRLVLREKWNPGELYETLISSICDTTKFWEPVRLLFACLLKTEYHNHIAENIVLSNREAISSKNLSGLIYLLGILAGKGSVLARLSLEELKNQDLGDEIAALIDRCILAYCR